MSSLAPLLLVVAGADLFGPAVGLELTYAGRLTPVAVADKTAAEKGFAVTWFLPRAGVGRTSNLFAVTEDAAALPWPARFGFCAPDGGEAGPRIGYRFADHDHLVPLPGAALKDAEEAMKSDDKARIEAATQALAQSAQKLAEQAYAHEQAKQQQGQAAGAQSTAGTGSAGGAKQDDGNVVDAEYEEVKEDKK